MSRLSLAPIDGNVFQKAMGLRPEIMKAWFNLDEEIRFKGELDPWLKEEVRRNLALGIGCEFCSSLGAPTPDKYDRKVSLAVAFAQLVFDNIHDLRAIDDSAFAVLREEFSEPAIIELVCWSLFLVAAQGFGAIMKIRPADSTEVQEYKDWRAAGEAQAA
jgi:alkylhydroperoxidase family enzyme